MGKKERTSADLDSSEIDGFWSFLSRFFANDFSGSARLQGPTPSAYLPHTPTSASWLNMVERFFRDLTTKRLRRGVFHSVPELVAALEGYLQTYNQEPTPFVWTAKAKDILMKVKRARKRLQTRRK